jgi:hypothetical protein
MSVGLSPKLGMDQIVGHAVPLNVGIKVVHIDCSNWGNPHTQSPNEPEMNGTTYEAESDLDLAHIP